MRDPFGIHARRIRRALKDQLRAGDEIEAYARDDLAGDYWVLTNRELLQLHSSGAVRTRLDVAELVGSVTVSSAGVSVRMSSRRDAGRALIGSFRGDNEVTRRLAALLQPPSR